MKILYGLVPTLLAYVAGIMMALSDGGLSFWLSMALMAAAGWIQLSRSQVTE